VKSVTEKSKVSIDDHKISKIIEDGSEKNQAAADGDPEKFEVKITADIPFLDVNHQGQVIRIQRSQDKHYKVTNSFAKTSRKCPPFCIRPIKIAKGIETVGEIELLAFLKNEVRTEVGLLVDARLKDWHVKGTIPGSVSIPFTMFTGGLKDINTVSLLELLGAREGEDDTWIFDEAVKLMLFCNGPWCGQSPKAIKALLKLGYPAEKIFWYRGGMQAWLSFGLTVIKPKSK
jgi:rhodanese-related sulfurtransferase